MRNDGWAESTEGDLDPDLTEEAGYAGWEAPARSRWQLLQRVVLGLTLLAMIGATLLLVVR